MGPKPCLHPWPAVHAEVTLVAAFRLLSYFFLIKHTLTIHNIPLRPRNA